MAYNREMKYHLLDLRRFSIFSKNLTRCGKTWDTDSEPSIRVDESLVLTEPLDDLNKMCKHCMRDLKCSEGEFTPQKVQEIIDKFHSTQTV